MSKKNKRGNIQEEISQTEGLESTIELQYTEEKDSDSVNNNISNDANTENVKENSKQKNNAKKKVKEKKPLQPNILILLGAGTITSVLAATNILSIKNYNAENYINIDTSRIDKIKNFIQTETTDKYVSMIEKHTNEEQNKSLDIQTVFSGTGREYPFTPILNKSVDNSTTKLCKFIYTELKPAIISYKIANNTLPVGEEKTESDIINLELLTDLINIRDIELEEYTYKVVDNSVNSNIIITPYRGDEAIPIILFDIKQFEIKNLTPTEVSLSQGKWSLILKPMEEYNNVRVKKIDAANKTVTLVDTITGASVNLIQR